MKKVFVSLPMRDIPEKDVLAAMEAARRDAENIIGEPCELIDTYFKDGLIEPLECLGDSIRLMHGADVVYFVKGWADARGCRIEHEAAVLYGKDRIEPKENYIGMNFSRALEMLKLGHHLTRLGWNGMGQYVVYQKGYPDGISCNKQTAEAWGIKEGDLFKVLPYLQICLVSGDHAMWVPSITDLLASDWELAPSDPDCQRVFFGD
ncbi:MAG: DUF2829 domain-containing protein [Ruminococcus flavefaciens]|nr:DUF2829 domain-containing protein [Ruminococcus flavefaciens]